MLFYHVICTLLLGWVYVNCCVSIYRDLVIVWSWCSTLLLDPSRAFVTRSCYLILLLDLVNWPVSNCCYSISSLDLDTWPCYLILLLNLVTWPLYPRSDRLPFGLNIDFGVRFAVSLLFVSMLSARSRFIVQYSLSLWYDRDDLSACYISNGMQRIDSTAVWGHTHISSMSEM